MPQQKRSVAWQHFTALSSTLTECNHCSQQIVICSGNVGNMKRHIARKHPNIDLDGSMTDDGGQSVVYEYIIENNSDNSNDSNTGFTKLEHVEIPNKHKVKSLAHTNKHDNSQQEKTKPKSLIDQLTEEKISIAILQKELVEKELEEKKLRLVLLQKELQQFQKEMDHKQQMHELEKEEMLLRIETLKCKLQSKNSTDNDLPNLNLN